MSGGRQRALAAGQPGSPALDRLQHLGREMRERALAKPGTWVRYVIQGGSLDGIVVAMRLHTRRSVIGLAIGSPTQPITALECSMWEGHVRTIQIAFGARGWTRAADQYHGDILAAQFSTIYTGQLPLA